MAFCMYDEFTHELGVHVSERRCAEGVESALLDFSGPDAFVTTDNAYEISKAMSRP